LGASEPLDFNIGARMNNELNIIDQILEEKIDENIPFNAYDITKQAHKIHSLLISHHQIERYVYGYMRDEDYTSTKDYDKCACGPTTYTPIEKPVPITNNSTFILDSLFKTFGLSPSNTVVVPHTRTLKPDKSGRITVPNKLIRILRWDADYYVGVIIKDNTLTLESVEHLDTVFNDKTGKFGFNFPLLCIDKSDNIRISKKWWGQLKSTQNENEFVCRIENGKIVITGI
jgi:hypothetical protein